MSDIVDSPVKSTESNLYNNEAAQNAFFNAPKITFRNTRVKQKNIRELEEEEVEHEIYDENVDQELNEKIALHLKEFFNKKITLRNAFENPILDKLPAVAQVEPLQCVGAMLDASARVYAFRVDNTHCECFNVKTNIDEANTSFNKEESDFDSDETKSNNTEDFNENPKINEKNVSESVTIKKTLKKKKQIKIDLELPNRLEDLYKKSNHLAENFIKHTFPNEKKTGSCEELNEIILKNFDNYLSQMHDIMMSRRVGIPYIEQKMLGLNRIGEEYNIDDPIYQKVSRQFEEGCAQSFVNNEVLTNNDGSFLILHTNWKNNEPFTTKFIFDTKNSDFYENDLMLKYIEGALERALSFNPTDLPLLQEFCEEEEENCEKKNNKIFNIRFLGRKSQENTLPCVTNSQTSKSGGKDSSESECEFALLPSINEELVKFQMYLDENLSECKNIAKDPFETIEFLPNDFASNYVQKDKKNNSAVHKALLNALIDLDALKQFGIKPEIMYEVRNELKNFRKLSKLLLEKLQLEKKLSNKFALFVNTKLLGEDDVTDNFDEKEQTITNFLVTRFAPLIDSIWHAVIKSASEDDLVKTGLFFGNKNIRRIRHLYQKKNLTSRRRKLHLTSGEALITETPAVQKRPKMTKKTEIIEFSQNSDTDDLYHNATPSTSNLNKIEKKEQIFFWARPRQYPIVYLGQVIDVRDNPMVQQGVEMYVDMEDVFVSLDEIKNKRVSLLNDDTNLFVEKVKQINIEECDNLKKEMNINDSIIRDNQFMEQNNFENNVAQNNNLLCNTNFVIENNEDVLLPNVDDVSEPPFFDVDIEINNGINLINDSLNNENNFLKVVNEIDSNFKQNIENKEKKNYEDKSHWKGGNVIGLENNDKNKDKQKKKKKPKTGPTKTKRRRLNSNTSIEMGDLLTKEMYWDAADKLNSEILNLIKKHQTNKKPSDLIYNIDRRKSGEPKVFLDQNDFAVDVTGEYNSLNLIQSSLFYKNCFGFWGYEKQGENAKTKFYSCRDKLKLQSIEEQCTEFMFYYFKRFDKKIDLNLSEKNANCLKLNNDNLYTEKSFSDDEISENFNDNNDYYNLNFGIKNTIDNNLYTDEENKNTEWKMEENLEFNGGIIKIRQSRINAPMVKKAISLILSAKKNDIYSLTNLQTNFFKEKNLKQDKENCLSPKNTLKFLDNNLNAEKTFVNQYEKSNVNADNYNINNENEDQNILSSNDDEDLQSSNASSSSWSSESVYDEINQVNDIDQNKKLKNLEELQKLKTLPNSLKINGEHTFESVLAHLSEHLSGRTKRDLNVINAFSIILHMCNENKLQLIQDKDKKNFLVKPKSMTSFKIQHFDSNF